MNNAPNIKAMGDAIQATLYHSASTDKKPNHRFCPKGETSWCKYNRAKATKEKPPSHDSMSLKLNPLVVKHLKPLYKRLAEEEKILSKCTRTATQNANESLHSVLWKYCPKEIFVSRPRLEVAAARAVPEFNMGAEAALLMRKEMEEEEIAVASVCIARKRDQRRQDQSSHQKVRNQERRKRKMESKRQAAAAKKKKKKGDKEEYEPGGY